MCHCRNWFYWLSLTDVDSEDEGCWFVSLVLVGSLSVPRGFSIFYYFAIFLLVAPLHRLVFIILTRLQTHYSSFLLDYLPVCPVSCLTVCVQRELSGSSLCTWDVSLYCSHWQISGYKNKPTEIALIVLFLYCTNVSRDVRSCSWRWTGLYIHQSTELDPSMMSLMYCKLMHCSVRIICSSGFQRGDVGTLIILPVITKIVL